MIGQDICLIFFFILILKFWVHTRQNVHSETKLMTILLMLSEEDCFFFKKLYIPLIAYRKVAIINMSFFKHVSLTNIPKMTIKLRSEPWEWALEMSLGNEPWKWALEMSLGNEPWEWAHWKSFGNEPYDWAMELNHGNREP